MRDLWLIIIAACSVLASACRKDEAPPLPVEDDPEMRWTWDISEPDTFRPSTATMFSYCSRCAPGNIDDYFCLEAIWHRVDADSSSGTDWRLVVSTRITGINYSDTIGTVVTSHLGECDSPLAPGSVIRTDATVFYNSTIHDARPSVNCTDHFDVRHIGFVRLKNGVKQAGYARLRSVMEPSGNRAYWLDQLCFSKVPWAGIRIL